MIISGCQRRRKSVSGSILSGNSQTIYQEKTRNESWSSVGDNHVSSSSDIISEMGQRKSPNVLAETLIHNFGSYPDNPIRSRLEIPPLSKTRSGKLDHNKENSRNVIAHEKHGFIESLSIAVGGGAMTNFRQADHSDVNVNKTIRKETMCVGTDSVKALKEVENNTFFSPEKLSIKVDDDISFSIESPSADSSTHKETPKRILRELQLGNIEQVCNNLEKSFDEETNPEIEVKNDSHESMLDLSDSINRVKMKRHMITAIQGRYICPSATCSFKCESKVILNIHVRKRHVDMFGSQLRKEKMKAIG